MDYVQVKGPYLCTDSLCSRSVGKKTGVCVSCTPGKIPLTVDESFGIIESRLADGAQYNVIWSQEQQS